MPWLLLSCQCLFDINEVLIIYKLSLVRYLCCLTAIFSTTEQHILDSQKYVELFWKLILEFKCKIHYSVLCIWPSLSKSVWCLNTCEQKQYLLDRKSIISAITFIIKTFEHILSMVSCFHWPYATTSRPA